MDNNEVYALFEDIKNNLKGINGKLENTPKVSNDQSGGQPPTVNLTPIKELFDSSAKEHQAQTKAMLTKFAEAEVYASNRILGLLRNLKESFARSSEERKNEPQEHIHRHCFDVRDRKIFIAFFSLACVCILSVWGNYSQWQYNRHLKDADLKYRALKIALPSENPDVAFLEKHFTYQRNESVIKRIEERVNEYEDSVRFYIEMIQTAAYKDSIGNRLLKESEIIKGKLQRMNE